MSQEDQPTLCDQLKSILGEKLIDCQGDDWELTIEVASADWLEVAKQLRDEAVLSFSQLIDLCGVDYLGYGDSEWNTASVSSEGYSRAAQGNGPGRFGWESRPSVEMERRFAVVAHLLSTKFNTRLRMRCFCLETHAPVVPSLVDVWASANWFEREAFDLLGVLFEGHPDLRRILTDYGFVGHPLRKDFPLSGNVEMRYDEDEGRVIYEPVSIEPRVLVPRVIRHDSRYAQSENGGERSDG